MSLQANKRIICLGFFIIFSIHQSLRWWALFTNGNGSPKNIEEKKRVLAPPMPSSSVWRPSQPIWCDLSHILYDVCTLNEPTVMDPTTSTFLVTATSPDQITQKIRPYPGKWSKENMLKITEITLRTSPSPTGKCHHSHDAPALVFSTGGFIGNVFHDFGDVLVPLFITLRLLFHERDPPVFVVTDYQDWWLPKYEDILSHLTPHPIINLDNETATHCFPSAQLGLVAHCYLSMDPASMPRSESILDFRALLDRSYSGGGYHQAVSRTGRRPRLVLARRQVGGRVITNHEDLVRIAKKVGFDVVNFEPNRFTPLREIYKMINASHALFGVHGAALTHFFFLRPGSVFIQVVPIAIDWLAEIIFGKPARQLGLEYMEYKIRVEESSLAKKYKRGDVVLKKQTRAFLDTYLRNQDVTLDLFRVTSLLEKAFHKAKRFMDKEG